MLLSDDGTCSEVKSGTRGGWVKLDLRNSKHCAWVGRGWNNVEVRVVLNRLGGRTLELSIRYKSATNPR